MDKRINEYMSKKGNVEEDRMVKKKKDLRVIA